MGGALDSTNVIDAPEVAVITNIGLEHTEYLGDTIEKIARTKAGIIKPGCACVCYDGPREAAETVQAVCREKGVPLTRVNFGNIQPLDHDLSGQRFRWKGEELSLTLLGSHQLHNAAVVLETVDALRRRGWSIPGQAVQEGLRTVRWPARFEVLGREPLFVLDGGHNPQCAQAMAEILTDYLPEKKVTFLMGVLADKDWWAMLDSVAPHAARFVCVTPDSPRSLEGERLAAELTHLGFDAEACATVEEGIRTALAAGGPVVAFGSLYMAGAVRTAFRPVYRTCLRKSKIKARDALGADERARLSEQIVRQIVASDEFQKAQTVLIYRATRGEARLEMLATAPESQGKRLVFPLCIRDMEMIALLPNSEDAWVPGYCGILEPVQEMSTLIQPEEIDLVLCPGTVFDNQCNRMGMGAGFYDRYLEKCINAKVALVAFECQKTAQVPIDSWDKPMEVVFTEANAYRRKPAVK